MKKKIGVIFLLVIFSFLVLGGIGCYYCYQDCLKAVGSEDEKVVVVIEKGTTSRGVIDVLYDANLIKNKYAGYVYLKLNEGFNLQAGVYDLNRGMDLQSLLDYIGSGKVLDNSISVTFVEGIKLDNFKVDKDGNVNKKGIKLKSYAKTISANFDYTEKEVLEKLSDKKYLATLVDKYWFLTDEILNDKLYYALEGYLAPNTYYFDKDSKLEDIIERLLDCTGIILSEYKEEIENSKYSVHEIMTLASIIERESGTGEDTQGIAGVFYNRLNNNWALGSDVTTYYASKVELADREINIYEINDYNGYNTRNAKMAGKLPIGPICSPSKEAVIAAINPKKHDYFYFVADKNGKTYFTKTYQEHINKVNELKKNGLWYEY